MKAFFSILYWLFFGVSAAVLFLVALGLWAVTAPFDSQRCLLHRFTCWWATLYLRVLPGCRLVIEGRERLDPAATYVFVANHQAMTDIMALSALHVPFKWVSKKEAFRLPCIGWNMALNQYISVDRGNVRSLPAMIKTCRGWLERGVSLLMFPEGTRSPDGEIHDFHEGAFKLAAEAGVAVVPIVVDGTRGVYRGWRVEPFPGRITIRILDPVRLADFDGNRPAMRAHVQARMRETLAEIRSPRSDENKPAASPGD